MNRPEMLHVRFPQLGITLRAKLLWDMNPESCELFIKNLPFETIYSHTMASGLGMYAPHRIVAKLKAKYQLLTEVQDGTLTLSTGDYKTVGFFYGPMTEPLPLAPIAHIIPEDHDAMRRACREVWISNYMTHEPIHTIFEIAPAKVEAAQ